MKSQGPQDSTVNLRNTKHAEYYTFYKTMLSSSHFLQMAHHNLPLQNVCMTVHGKSEKLYTFL